MKVPNFPRFEIEIENNQIFVYRDLVLVDHQKVSKKFPYARYGNGRCQYVKRAELVLSVFAGPRPVGLEACHGDGNYLNDLPENLYWGTHAQNMADISKINASEILELKSDGFTQREMAKILNISTTSIERHIRRMKCM